MSFSQRRLCFDGPCFYRSRPIPVDPKMQHWWAGRVKKEDSIRQKWIEEYGHTCVVPPGGATCQELFAGRRPCPATAPGRPLHKQKVHPVHPKLNYWDVNPQHISSDPNICPNKPYNYEMPRWEVVRRLNQEYEDPTLIAHHPKYGMRIPCPASRKIYDEDYPVVRQCIHCNLQRPSRIPFAVGKGSSMEPNVASNSRNDVIQVQSEDKGCQATDSPFSYQAGELEDDIKCCVILPRKIQSVAETRWLPSNALLRSDVENFPEDGLMRGNGQTSRKVQPAGFERNCCATSFPSNSNYSVPEDIVVAEDNLRGRRRVIPANETRRLQECCLPWNRNAAIRQGDGNECCAWNSRRTQSAGRQKSLDMPGIVIDFKNMRLGSSAYCPFFNVSQDS